jgi:GAF domain-containing protein
MRPAADTVVVDSAAVLDELERFSGDRARMLGVACRRLVELLRAEGCLISRVVGTTLIEVVEHAASGRSLHLGHGFFISDYPLTQEVLERREPRSVSLRDPEPDPREAAFLREMGFDALLMLPLGTPKECWGLVELFASGERRFGVEDARAAEQVVSRAGELL